jgi:hypothetical protein
MSGVGMYLLGAALSSDVDDPAHSDRNGQSRPDRELED